MRSFLIALAVATILGAVGLGYLHYRNTYEQGARNAAALLRKKEDYKLTIPEGWRREQIAQALQDLGICSKEDFLAASKDKEGYLFPDTYRFFKDTPATDVVAAMTATFDKRTAGLSITRDTLVLASIVEREAASDAERADIAGVYANRLKIGMALEADPTVQYGKDTNAQTALGKNPLAANTSFDFWGPITQANYRNVISPYNTYLNVGLPPGPIANPGIKSIEAALSPTKHSYYYFLHRNGKILFSKTLQEHVGKQ